VRSGAIRQPIATQCASLHVWSEELIYTDRSDKRVGINLMLSEFMFGRVVDNVFHKRAGHTSEPVKILHILPSTTNYTSKVEDIETKQIVL
jgi:hypothetical protein